MFRRMNDKRCSQAAFHDPPTRGLNPSRKRPRGDRRYGSGLSELRPDGFALNVKKQEIAILEFTRAMDTDVQWAVRKDAEKRRRSLTSSAPLGNAQVGNYHSVLPPLSVALCVCVCNLPLSSRQRHLVLLLPVALGVLLVHCVSFE